MIYTAKYWNGQWSKEILLKAISRNNNPFDGFSLSKQLQLDFGMLDYQADEFIKKFLTVDGLWQSIVALIESDEFKDDWEVSDGHNCTRNS